jgi:hypothetical protein
VRAGGGGVLGYEEAAGSRFEVEMEPTGGHRALSTVAKSRSFACQRRGGGGGGGAG